MSRADFDDYGRLRSWQPVRPTRPTFTVSGRGDFPRDMLRYDDCEFASPDDAVRAGDGYVHDRRRVKIVTQRRALTAARWESFGWRIVADGEPDPVDPPRPAERLSVVAMTPRELQAEADAVARRIARGTTTIGDSMVVIELANRLLRHGPRE